MGNAQYNTDNLNNPVEQKKHVKKPQQTGIIIIEHNSSNSNKAPEHKVGKLWR